MGIVGSTGKVVRREVGHLVGEQGIKVWWNLSRRSWLGAKRSCPACGAGRMFRFSEAVDGVDREFYGCSKCDHYETADLSNESDVVVAESLGRLRDISGRRMTSMKKSEREALMRRLKRNSRAQYAFSLVLLSVGIYLLVATAAAWSFLNATAFATLMFAHGLRSAYRYWQVSENVFYQPGSFRRWLGLGQWLI